jgi:hypothetical protein
MSEAVRSTAMLADVTISTWSGERTDAKLMEQVKASAGAIGNTGRVIKNLLAGADGLLRDTRAAYAAVRATHCALTLPWVSDPHATRMTGPRLLPTALFERYLTEMSARKTAALKALDAFIDAYPDLVVQARANLAGMADATYPDAAEVRATFKVAFDFEPIPEGNAFKGLPDSLLGKLSRSLEAKQTRMITTAQAAMWVTVHDRVAHMERRLSERLADPAKTFHLTTVENVRELVDLLHGWNVASDERVHEVIGDIATMLSGVTSEQIRAKPDVCKDVAEQAQGLLARLDQWGV